MRWPSSRSAITRKVRPPADEGEGWSEGDFMAVWMKNCFWSIVRWAEASCLICGRTSETRLLALAEAREVCSARTVVWKAMQALRG